MDSRILKHNNCYAINSVKKRMGVRERDQQIKQRRSRHAHKTQLTLLPGCYDPRPRLPPRPHATIEQFTNTLPRTIFKKKTWYIFYCTSCELLQNTARIVITIITSLITYARATRNETIN
ncbi:unnamed protein product [Ectocarpus sp. 12 AP-2014]